MKYTAIIRGRPKIEVIDDFMGRINKTMHDFGFEEKTLYNAEIATASIEVDKELTSEDKNKIAKAIRKEFEKLLSDVTVKIIREY